MRTYCGEDNNIYPDDKMDLQWETDIRPVINAGGTGDYNYLSNKPSINGIQLVGNKSNEDLLINAITNEELETLLK